MQGDSVTRKGIIPHLTSIKCGVCREYIGSFFDSDGYSAQWWADKALQEHTADYHEEVPN